MSDKGLENKEINESVTESTNVNVDENDLKLEEFLIDGEKVLLPLYDIEIQEKIDNNMEDGVDVFYSNDYEKAKEIFSRYKSDPLHMLGCEALNFMIALITFDKEKIANSLKTLDSIERKASKQIDRVNSDEKKAGNGSSFMSKFYKKKTKKIINAKLRATVIKAECNLLSAALYLFQENMVGFVKAAFCLRKVWSGYYSCWNEIKDNLEENKKLMDKHTYYGILFGIGSSKLLLSVLPPKIISIISIFGISSDREHGMSLLKQCINEKNLYTPMALSVQLFYYSIFNSLAPATVSSEELEIGEQLINKGLETYPNSAVQLYFQGRFVRLLHNLETSTEAFTLGNEAQHYFVDLNHLFEYELVLNTIFNQEWEKGIELLDSLIKDKYYSEIFFTYLAGILYCMTNNIEKTKEYFNKFEDLYKNNQGKTTDIEQYCQGIIQRIKEDNYTNVEVAVLEFMYLWDGIPCMDKKTLEKALALKNDDDNIDNNKNDSENNNNNNNEDSSESINENEGKGKEEESMGTKESLIFLIIYKQFQ